MTYELKNNTYFVLINIGKCFFTFLKMFSCFYYINVDMKKKNFNFQINEIFRENKLYDILKI